MDKNAWYLKPNNIWFFGGLGLLTVLGIKLFKHVSDLKKNEASVNL